LQNLSNIPHVNPIEFNEKAFGIYKFIVYSPNVSLKSFKQFLR